VRKGGGDYQRITRRLLAVQSISQYAGKRRDLLVKRSFCCSLKDSGEQLQPNVMTGDALLQYLQAHVEYRRRLLQGLAGTILSPIYRTSKESMCELQNWGARNDCRCQCGRCAECDPGRRRDGTSYDVVPSIRNRPFELVTLHHMGTLRPRRVSDLALPVTPALLETRPQS